MSGKRFIYSAESKLPVESVDWFPPTQLTVIIVTNKTVMNKNVLIIIATCSFADHVGHEFLITLQPDLRDMIRLLNPNQISYPVHDQRSRRLSPSAVKSFDLCLLNALGFICIGINILFICPADKIQVLRHWLIAKS